MISSHECRAQILLLVFTSDVRSGGTHKAGDSHSGIQTFPMEPFPTRHSGWASGKEGCCSAARPQTNQTDIVESIDMISA